jgi:hypothetical protein
MATTAQDMAKTESQNHLNMISLSTLPRRILLVSGTVDDGQLHEPPLSPFAHQFHKARTLNALKSRPRFMKLLRALSRGDGHFTRAGGMNRFNASHAEARSRP